MSACRWPQKRISIRSCPICIIAICILPAVSHWSADNAQHYSTHNESAEEACDLAGDQTDNLLYRLQNGETPKKAPKVAVVLIGTNDFGAVDMCYGSGTDLLETVPGASRRYSPHRTHHPVLYPHFSYLNPACYNLACPKPCMARQGSQLEANHRLSGMQQ